MTKNRSATFILLLLLTTLSAASEEYFISGELLGRPTANSISVELVPAVELEIYIEYGKSPGAYRSKTSQILAQADNVAELKINALKANKKYYYRLVYKKPADSSWLRGEEHSFQTQRKKKDEFSFAILSDSHLDKSKGLSGFQATLQNIAAHQPDFLIDLGDTFMTDRLKNPSIDNIKSRMLEVRGYFQEICHSIPLFLALGNHAGENGYFLNNPNRKDLAINASLLRMEYFPNPAPDSFYTGNSVAENDIGLRENYYAWTWGSAIFIVLDPHWYTTENPMRSKDNWDRTLGKTQYDWLEKTLESSKTNFKFIFIHNLAGGSDNYGRGGAEAAPYFEWGGYNKDGSEGFSSNRKGWPLPVHDLLKKYGVQAVFHGHDHSYACQEYDGIIYQLVPQPGKTRDETEPEAASHGYKSGTILTGSGHLRVTVNKKLVEVAFVQSSTAKDNGKVLHQWQLQK